MLNRCPELPLEPPDEKERVPHCPVCEAECERVIYDTITHTYIGCDVCKPSYDAWDVPACFPPEEDDFPCLA